MEGWMRDNKFENEFKKRLLNAEAIIVSSYGPKTKAGIVILTFNEQYIVKFEDLGLVLKIINSLEAESKLHLVKQADDLRGFCTFQPTSKAEVDLIVLDVAPYCSCGSHTVLYKDSMFLCLNCGKKYCLGCRSVFNGQECLHCGREG